MDGQTHILIVDDDPDICDALNDYLSGEGYRVSLAHDGVEGRRVLAQSAVDIVLLDLVLPDQNGLEIARSLRAENPGLGIIMLTGRGDTVDRIIGLEMGADDYLPKPFHLRELLARIKSVERRVITQSATLVGATAQLRFAGWTFDPAARELLSPSGESVRLTTGEFDLLAVFIAHPNQVLSRDKLLDLSRNREAGPFDRTVDVQVGRVRRKLGDDPKQPRLIRTVRGGGYLFTAPVEAVRERLLVDR